MNPIHYRRPAATLWVTALAASLALATAARAQTQPAAPAPTAAPVVTAHPPGPAPVLVKPAGSIGAAAVMSPGTPVPAKPKPGSEGMAVHGHWVIEVKNSDGSVAEHRDFENALQDPTELLGLLAGQFAAGDLALLTSSSGPAPCITGSSSNTCVMVISTTVGIGGQGCTGTVPGACTTGMTETTSSGTGNIILNGTINVVQAASLTQVGTYLLTCSTGTGYPTISPQQCYALPSAGSAGITPNVSLLTGANITPVAVSPGQTVMFTVTLSFS